MSTPTLQSLSIRLSAIDGITAAVPSQSAIPVIENDLNGLHTTIDQLVLTLQSQWNTVLSQLAAIEAGLAGETLDQAIRVGTMLVSSGTLGGPYTVNFPAPFQDGLYTTEATITLAEAISTAECMVAGVQQQTTPGNGVLVWVANHDSINHTVTVNVFVRHD